MSWLCQLWHAVKLSSSVVWGEQAVNLNIQWTWQKKLVFQPTTEGCFDIFPLKTACWEAIHSDEMSLIHVWYNQSSWAFSASFDSQNMNKWVLLFWTLPWVSRAPLSRPKGQFPAGEETRLYWNVAGINKLPGKHGIKNDKKYPQKNNFWEQNDWGNKDLLFCVRCKIY